MYLFQSHFPLNRKFKHLCICETSNISHSLEGEKRVSPVQTTENTAASVRKLKNELQYQLTVSKAKHVRYSNYKLQPLQTGSKFFRTTEKKMPKVAGKTINSISTFSSVSCQVTLLLRFLKLSNQPD